MLVIPSQFVKLLVRDPAEQWLSCVFCCDIHLPVITAAAANFQPDYHGDTGQRAP